MYEVFSMKQQNAIKNKDMLVDFSKINRDNSWNLCLDALEQTYTLSITEACEILKCSRTWINRYIRPHIHYIYLSVTYAKAAAFILNRPIKDSVWLNRQEFESWIRSHITSCTRQVVPIPVEQLINHDDVNSFRVQYLDTKKCLKERFRYSIYQADLKKELTNLIQKYLSPIGKAIFSRQGNPMCRTMTPAINVPVPEFELTELMAPHDLKGYGGVDEIIYRDLFAKGCYRIVIGLPDADNSISEKIYYIKPQGDTGKGVYEKDSVQIVYVRYEDYVKFIKE